MTSPAGLLDHAEAVLNGHYDLGVRGPRVAALLTRCAFERWLNQISAAWTASAHDHPTPPSQLIVLGALRGTVVGDQAKRLWDRLSQAVHHHAYELQPSANDVRYLLAQTRVLMQDG